MSVIRHKIVRYVTDRPNQVVTKDEIMEAGDFSAQQVTTALRSIQQSSPIGAEIQTIVQGNAWRYVPTQPATSTDGRRTSNLTRPLTALLEEYLTNHPGVVIYVTTLVEHTGRTEDQVRVGINNMLQSRPHMKQHVEKVINGQAWRYVPSTSPRGSSRRSPSLPPSRTPAASPSVPTTSSETTSRSATVNGASVARTDAPRMFEEVGQLPDGRLVIRDQDDQLYQAAPLT